MNLTQQTFDFNRAERRGLIDDAEIGTGIAVDGSPVSGKTIKALLRVLEDLLGTNEWAWPSQTTLAKRLECSERTIRRATEAAEAMSLVITQRRTNAYGTNTLHYKLVWSELSLLNPAIRARWRELVKNQRSSTVPRSVDESVTVPRSHKTAKVPRPEAAYVDDRTLNSPPSQSSNFHRSNPPDNQPDIAPEQPDNVTDQPDNLTKQTVKLSGKQKENIHRTSPPPLKPTEESSWREVEEEVFVLGVVKASECIVSARMAGVSLTEIRAIIDRYLETMRLFPTHWTAPPFILFRRIQAQRPGFAIEQGWIGGLRPQTAKSVQYERSREHSREQRQALLETIHQPDSKATADDPEWRAMLSSLRSARIKSQ